MSRRYDDQRRSELSTIEVLLIAIFIVLAVIGLYSVIRYATTHLHPVLETQAEMAENEQVVFIPNAAASADVAISEPLLRVYCEGEGPAPEWWNPDEPMAAVWEDNAQQSDAHGLYRRHDVGCPDWNICTSLIGWSGHMMEPWEMELFVRITYLEFWGTSETCCEAGIDSILLLWDRGEYGRTMGELLSAEYAPGYYVYSPYAYVWSWEYDDEGLEDIREMCEKRFFGGPEWCAPYFRKGYYHDWDEWSPIPAYNIDNVYFSIPRW